MVDTQRELIVLPHIQVESELDLGKYILVSSTKLEKIPKIYHPHVRSFANLYCAIGYDIREIGLLVRKSARNRFAVLSEVEREEVQNVIDILVFSSSYQERAALFMTRDNFNFTIWTFRGDKPPTDHINLSSPRFQFHAVPRKPHSIQIPLHVRYARFGETGYDSHVLEALLPCAFSNSNDDRRIVRSIHWFNLAHTDSGDITNHSRFAMTAIAFETLLNTPHEKITEYFRNTIQMLLGESPELKKWADDFYKKRSTLMHGGGMPDLMYGKDKHNSVLALADIIFIQCVYRHLVLLGYWGTDLSESVRRKNVVKYLISNKVRFDVVTKFKLTDGEQKASLVQKYLYTIQRNAAGPLRENSNSRQATVRAEAVVRGRYHQGVH